MDFASVCRLQPRELAVQTLIFQSVVLVMMQKIVYFELQLRNCDLFATELVLHFNQFVFELDSKLAFTIEVILKFLFRLPKFFPFVLQHELDLAKVLLVNS